MGKRKGLPSATFNYYNVRGICEENVLSRAIFNNQIRWWKWEKVKSYLEPPSATAYFVGMWEEKKVVSSHLCYHKMMRI